VGISILLGSCSDGCAVATRQQRSAIAHDKNVKAAAIQSRVSEALKIMNARSACYKFSMPPSPSDLLCIGHRGAMGHAPENTLASFATALALGAPCVELDVQLVEGRLLVFHDERLERTTNGHGAVRESGFDYLRSLDAGQGELIPTLDEVLALIDRRAGVNIELKGPGTALPVAACLARLREQGWAEQLLLVSAFDREQLHALRERDPLVRLGLLAKHWHPQTLDQALHLRAYSINLTHRVATAERVTQAQTLGLRLLAYTVNSPQAIARMRHIGVDGVFSNYPERVLKTNSKPSLPGWP
jgi:glycerophosphoryl diester phosphodiesterase